MTVAPRSPTDGSGLLRAAVVVLLILGVPSAVVLLTRQPVSSWQPTSRLEVSGDTWDGNLATDGNRVYLMTREDISGFWGVLKVRSSADSGRTWGEPVRVSAEGGPSAARHTLTVGPDGSVWAAWAELGPQPSTQRLMLRRSRDHGLTWEAPQRLSPEDVGLIGIPALVMTPDSSFVAYTDGEQGTVIVQALDIDGAAPTEPGVLRRTSRQLYDDSSFLDAGLGAAAVGDHMVIVANDGDGFWRSVAWPGQDWFQAAWQVVPTFAPARVAAVDGRMTMLAAIPTDDGNVKIITETSSDGGWTWAVGATWSDPNASEVSLAVAPDKTVVLWESCDRFCLTSVIRVAVVGAAGGQVSRIVGPGGRMAGAVMTGDTMVAAWVRQGPQGLAEDRTVVIATGPRP